MDMHYHFIHECVEDGTLDISHISTMEMLANELTKLLMHVRHE